MKMILLGTGSAEGLPSPFCCCPACTKARTEGTVSLKTRSSALLDDVLIDCSPDILTQTFRNALDFSTVRNLVLTHSHPDHLNTHAICMRLKKAATIIPERGEQSFHVYGNASSLSVIEKALLDEKSSDRKLLDYHTVEAFRPFSLDGKIFVPIKANHRKNEDCFIYSVSDGKSCVLYALDTGRLPSESLEWIAENGEIYDAVIMDSARGTLPGDGHMGLEDNIELKDYLLRNGKVHNGTLFILSHYSHMCGLSPGEYSSVAAVHGFSLGYDGEIFDI